MHKNKRRKPQRPPVRPIQPNLLFLERFKLAVLEHAKKVQRKYTSLESAYQRIIQILNDAKGLEKLSKTRNFTLLQIPQIVSNKKEEIESVMRRKWYHYINLNPKIRKYLLGNGQLLEFEENGQMIFPYNQKLFLDFRNKYRKLSFKEAKDKFNQILKQGPDKIFQEVNALTTPLNQINTFAQNKAIKLYHGSGGAIEVIAMYEVALNHITKKKQI